MLTIAYIMGVEQGGDRNMNRETVLNRLEDSPWQEWLSCSETQLAHIFEPEPGLFIAESPNVIERAVQAGYQPYSFLIDTAFFRENVRRITAQFPEIPVFLAENRTLNSVRGLHLTRGVLCAMRRKKAEPLSVSALGNRVVILENIENPTNLGAVFRSAAAIGMDTVLLTKGCTDPLYRRAARVSTGTVFQIPWYSLPEESDAADTVRLLQSEGYLCAAMALNENSLSLDDVRLKGIGKLAVVLGTEGEGLHAETVAACDYTVRIPMLHGVDSLNVAAAAAVAFWELRNR